MTQLLRVCKLEVCCVARSYGTRRYQQNHYETLNVSPDASQKEIRRAFIRLSKQVHPDVSGKQDHVDFVSLYEAYKILRKENTRRRYDFDLKYCKDNPSYTYNSQNTKYSSQWEYEVRTAGGPWPPPRQKVDGRLGLAIVLTCLGLALLQTIFLFHSVSVRKRVYLRCARIEKEYQQIRNVARTRTTECSIENLNSE